MKVHNIKCVQPHYDDIASGVKTFEVRLNDRDYDLNDRLELFEYDADTDQFSGKVTRVLVRHLLNDDIPGIETGYVVMGIRQEGLEEDLGSRAARVHYEAANT